MSRELGTRRKRSPGQRHVGRTQVAALLSQLDFGNCGEEQAFCCTPIVIEIETAWLAADGPLC
jgi:hypothetical protein